MQDCQEEFENVVNKLIQVANIHRLDSCNIFTPGVEMIKWDTIEAYRPRQHAYSRFHLQQTVLYCTKSHRYVGDVIVVDIIMNTLKI